MGRQLLEAGLVGVPLPPFCWLGTQGLIISLV